MTALYAIATIAIIVTAGLAIWITPDDDNDHRPYTDDLEQLQRAADTRAALDRARRGEPPTHR